MEASLTADTPLADPLQDLKYRPDIDGLRAVAVLSVVGFHAMPTRLTGGFVGVDIFFVISGYLISSIIFQQVSDGRFSYLQFYGRRAKRIFPALIAVLFASYAFQWCQRLGDEFALLGKYIAGGAGFVAKFPLWSETGYAKSAAEAKPLLHLWSLAVEEQFYFVWPFLIVLAWRFKLKLPLMIVAIVALSFVLNLASVQRDSSAAFYSPLTRFWELLTGSLLAYASAAWHSASEGNGWLRVRSLLNHPVTTPVSQKLKNAMSVPGTALLAGAISLLNSESLFPVRWAVLQTFGALLVIAAGAPAWLNPTLLYVNDNHVSAHGALLFEDAIRNSIH